MILAALLVMSNVLSSSIIFLTLANYTVFLTKMTLDPITSCIDRKRCKARKHYVKFFDGDCA